MRRTIIAAAASPAERAGAWSSAYASARAYQERQLRLMLEARA